MPTSQKLRKYACPTCARSYVKAEHLARHQRIHTGAKPFICDDCGRHFSRSDSLARHVRRSHAEELSQGDELAQGQEGHTDLLSRADDEVSSVDVLAATSPEIDNCHAPADLDRSTDMVNNPGFHLNWPDSEALLQSILNTGNNDFTTQLEALPLEAIPPLATQQSSPWLPQNDDLLHPNNGEPVRDVSRIIAAVSANVTFDAGTVSLTTTFLDECLNLFFDRFIPILPVSHRPTFQYGEWTHPLLLNAISIGSLFLGEDMHVAQGQALWKLAHVAVATSWNTLMQHKAPEDDRYGVQLVTTALLGQTYAMLSANQKLRKTAQMFHSLGFYWARECDLYMRQRTFNYTTTIGVDGAPLYHEWKQWVAEELQLRTLLGHYILDSQLAQFISAPTSQRHTSNYLPLACSDRLFSARSAREWADVLLSEPLTSVTFQELFVRLYTSEGQPLPPNLSCLSLKVVLEGLRALLLESQAAEGPALGVQSALATSTALDTVYTYLCSAPHLSNSDEIELLLRWHSIYIDAMIDSVALSQDMCSIYKITQEVFGQRKAGLATFSSSSWPSSIVARDALLHASAVYDNMDKLPLSRVHAIHIPMSIFTASIVYCGFVLGGTTTVSIVEDAEWTSSGLLHSDVAPSVNTRSSSGRQYVLDGSGPSRNLIYELNVFLLRLRQINQPWGIATPLADILRQLIAKRAT